MIEKYLPLAGGMRLLGNPYHGRVQGGQAHLPNATTAPWNQPAQDAPFRHADHPGFTFKQRLPNAEEVERTEDELAQDALNGLEYRSDFIVAGADSARFVGLGKKAQVYGQPVGGWIYVAPDGSRWCANGGDKYWRWWQGDTLYIDFEFERFGIFGGEYEWHYEWGEFSTAEIGQAAPDIGTAGTGSNHAQVVDITPDGSKAIVMLIFGDVWENWQKFAIGFIELSLTGTPGVDFAMSVTVLRNREDTLGEIVHENPLTNSTMLSYRPGHDIVVTEEDFRDPETNCGFRELTSVANPFVVETTFLTGFYARTGVGENRAEVTDRVIAMWYDESGTAQPVTMTASTIQTINAPLPTAQMDDQDVTRRHALPAGGTAGAEGQCSLVNFEIEQVSTATQTLAREFYIGEETTVTLAFMGQSVTRQFLSETQYSRVQTRPYRENTLVGSTPITTVVSLINRDYIDGDLVREAVSDSDGSSTPLQVSTNGVPDPTLIQWFFASAGGAAIRRWSNNLVGLVSEEYYPQYTTTAEPAFSPGGLKQPTTALDYWAAPHGSYNPVTGEAYYPADTPVSWI